MPLLCIQPMRVATVPVCAAIWEKTLGFRRFPNKLAMLVDDRISATEKDALRLEVTTTLPCCTDEGMTGQLVESYPWGL